MYYINRVVEFTNNEGKFIDGYDRLVKTEVKSIKLAEHYIKKCYGDDCKKHAKELRREFLKKGVDKMKEYFEITDETGTNVTGWYWRREIWKA